MFTLLLALHLESFSIYKKGTLGLESLGLLQSTGKISYAMAQFLGELWVVQISYMYVCSFSVISY